MRLVAEEAARGASPTTPRATRWSPEAVAVAYERGKAISMASYLEIDGVIDPARPARWFVRGMDSVLPTTTARRFIDTW